MGTFVAKLKNRNSWFKLVDQVLNDDYSRIDLSDSMVYDPNNDMAHQWFKMCEFSAKPAFMPLLSDDIDVADLESLTRALYDDIEFIAFVDSEKFYIQNISKSSFLKKKWFAWDGQVLGYQTKENVIYINPIPNCIYDKSTDELYFMDISKAYAVFGDLKQDFKAATENEIRSFFETDIIEVDDFTVTNVGIANRKRITAILDAYNNYSDEQKSNLKNYIHTKLGNRLEYMEQHQSFKITSDKELKLLLYGMQRRYYTPLFEEETQVATNSTKISNLL